MRPLRILAGGLAIIALWGICLQLFMLRRHTESVPAKLRPAANALPWWLLTKTTRTSFNL